MPIKATTRIDKKPQVVETEETKIAVINGRPTIVPRTIQKSKLFADKKVRKSRYLQDMLSSD